LGWEAVAAAAAARPKVWDEARSRPAVEAQSMVLAMAEAWDLAKDLAMAMVAAAVQRSCTAQLVRCRLAQPRRRQ
jgi:hypothetical protein